MKQNHRGLDTRVAGHLLLGSVFIAGLGCAGAEPGDSSTHSDPVAELGQELRGRHQRSALERRHQRGFWRGRRHAPPAPQPPPPPPPAAQCGPSSVDELLQLINDDVSALDSDDQPFQRYVTLVDRAPLLGCGRTLDGERAALSKLVNSVSIAPVLSRPVAIDADETVYRLDLRDYGWDRQLSVAGDTFPDGWEALIASTPYALELVGEDADDAKADLETAVPVLLSGPFLAAVARAPLYYSLLDIPADADELLSAALGVDVAGDDSIRAGFRAQTRAGERDFLAERFEQTFRAGYVWQLSEFGGDLLDDPLGAAQGERELTFTLPNGLLAHVLADGNGQVIDTSDVLLDAAESDQRARIATSFLALRAQGVEVTDEVRAFVLANPGNFSVAERAAILALYPAAAELRQLLDSDRDDFVGRALQALDIDLESEPEPISQSFNDFSAAVDAATAAAELFVSSEELLDNLALLDPSLESLAGGTVSREVFTQAYLSSLCILGAVEENQVNPALCQ